MAYEKEQELLKAAGNGDENKVKKLIMQGVNVNYFNDEDFTSPMSAAVESGHANVVKILLDNPNIQVGEGDLANLIRDAKDNEFADVEAVLLDFKERKNLTAEQAREKAAKEEEQRRAEQILRNQDKIKQDPNNKISADSMAAAKAALMAGGRFAVPKKDEKIEGISQSDMAAAKEVLEKNSPFGKPKAPSINEKLEEVRKTAQDAMREFDEATKPTIGQSTHKGKSGVRWADEHGGSLTAVKEIPNRYEEVLEADPVSMALQRNKAMFSEKQRRGDQIARSEDRFNRDFDEKFKFKEFIVTNEDTGEQRELHEKFGGTSRVAESGTLKSSKEREEALAAKLGEALKEFDSLSDDGKKNKSIVIKSLEAIIKDDSPYSILELLNDKNDKDEFKKYAKGAIEADKNSDERNYKYNIEELTKRCDKIEKKEQSSTLKSFFNMVKHAGKILISSGEDLKKERNKIRFYKDKFTGASGRDAKQAARAIGGIFKPSFGNNAAATPNRPSDSQRKR